MKVLQIYIERNCRWQFLCRYIETKVQCKVVSILVFYCSYSFCTGIVSNVIEHNNNNFSILTASSLEWLKPTLTKKKFFEKCYFFGGNERIYLRIFDKFILTLQIPIP